MELLKTGTTILAARTQEGGVVLCADRQSTWDNTLETTRKYYHYQFLVGAPLSSTLDKVEIYTAVAGYGAGNRHYQKAIIDCFSSPVTLDCVATSKVFFKTLSQKLAEAWEKETALGLQIMTNSVLVVVYKRNKDVDVRVYDGVGSYSSETPTVVSVGSGKTLAIGAYDAMLWALSGDPFTKVLPQQQTKIAAEKALRIAAKRDLYSGGKGLFTEVEIDIVSIPPG